MGYYNRVGIDVLIGQIITKIENDGDLYFHTLDGKKYRMYHSQDCCESVYLADIEGDLDDLLNTPILQAEEVANDAYEEEWLAQQQYVDSYTWTFYKLATINGYVTLRWLGESNGYYSESVDFEDITNE